jgi:hypothetical protein
MAKIDNEGLEKLQHIRNALDAAYDTLEKNGSFAPVAEYFQYVTEIIEDAKNNWEKV